MFSKRPISLHKGVISTIIGLHYDTDNSTKDNFKNIMPKFPQNVESKYTLHNNRVKETLDDIQVVP